MRITNTNVNLRASGVSGARILKVIPKNTLVEVYTCGPKWCKVKTQQRVGWLVGSALSRY
ncbi:SH3 domain-containing protein [Deinococcus carri]